MKTKNQSFNYRIAIIVLVMMVVAGCEKSSNSPNNLPVLSTTNATDITQSTAFVSGNITDDGGSAVIERGMCWSTNQNPTIANDKTSDGTGTGIFMSTITGLNPNTTYYARAYATNTNGTSYGNQISFTTTAASANSLTALIDGTPFVASGVTSSIVFDILGVTGFGGHQILLFMPEDITPGTYNIAEVGDYYAQFMPDGTSHPYYAQSGQLTITECNLAAKTVKGSFNMEVVIDSNTISITNGQFEVYDIFTLNY
jgi:hypothetical protein